MKTILKIQMKLLHIQLDEKTAKMTLEFKMKTYWSDKRLIFALLSEDSKKNNLEQEEINSIWIPELHFSNSKEKLEANFRNHSSAKVHLKPGHENKQNSNSLEILHFGYRYFRVKCGIFLCFSKFREERVSTFNQFRQMAAYGLFMN